MDLSHPVDQVNIDEHIICFACRQSAQELLLKSLPLWRLGPMDLAGQRPHGRAGRPIHFAAGRQRSVMARPMHPSMLLGVTWSHPAIGTSTNRTARSLLFDTSSHVKIVGVKRRYRLKPHYRPD